MVHSMTDLKHGGLPSLKVMDVPRAQTHAKEYNYYSYSSLSLVINTMATAGSPWCEVGAHLADAAPRAGGQGGGGGVHMGCGRSRQQEQRDHLLSPGMW